MFNARSAEVHTNSIICLQRFMHNASESEILQYICQVETPGGLTINKEFLLVFVLKSCGHEQALMEVFCANRNQQKGKAKKRMTTAILPLELCRS